MGQLTFRVLGSVGATLDGVPLDLGGWRQRSVLARLLVASGRVVPVEVLIGDLWHAETPPSAMSALQAHVSHLRRTLEPDRRPRTPAQVLVTSPPGYALRPDPDAVDAALAVRLLDEGDRLVDTDPATARERYSAALDLWQGPPYADYADEPWALPETARLEELRLIAVERRAAAALAAPTGRDPLPQLRAHVAEHPLREEGWRLLALGLYRAGRQGDALAALRAARERLAEDLGADPGPALRALEADVLAQAPELDLVRAPASNLGSRPPAPATPPAVPSPGAAPPVGEPLLVGRDAEQRALLRAAREAEGGRLRTAVVSGEAGSGKTTLLDDLAAGLGASGWTTCSVRCPESDGAPPAWPWTQALGTLAAAVPPGDPAAVAPLLADERTPGDHGDVPGNRFRLHQAVGRWLAAVADRAPLLLVVDDLHRADQETAALLVDLVAALAGSRVLLVVGHRTEETARLTDVLATLARRSPVALRLRGLDAEAVDRLVDDWASAPVDAATRAAISARTDGNPFYVRELLRLVDSGADVAEVPSTVRDVVRQRVGTLPGPTTSLLRLAAVCGRDVDVDVLLAAAGPADDEAAVDAAVEALETAVVSGLLVEPGPGRLRFVHALVRDTLYEDLSSLRRTRLHGRVAAVLERLRPDDVTGLAHHTAAAGPGSAVAALRWCQAAAELAERRFAHADAAQWWRRAVLAARSGTPEDHAGIAHLLAAQARATALAGASGPARALRAEALALLPVDASPRDVALTLLASDVPTFWNARVDPADDAVVARLEATIADLAPADPLRARLLAALATEFEERLEPRGPAASREAVRIAREAGDPTTLAYALSARAIHTHRDSDGGERAAIGAELLEVARREGLGAFETVARLVLLQDACGRMDFVDADVQAAEAERMAERHGLRLLHGIAHAYQGLRHALADRPAEAQAAYDEAVAELVAAGWYADVGESFRLIGTFCLALAADAGDRALPERVAAVFSAAPDDLREMWAAALVVSGRVEEAREVGPPRPRYGRDPFGPLFAYNRGLVGLALRDDERVAEALAGLAPHADTLCGIESGSVTTGPAATLLARLAAYRGDAAAAAAYQEQALALAERLGHPGWTAAARRALD